jgi:5-methyltetrahydrofolate--homocysteine methyltransferase
LPKDQAKPGEFDVFPMQAVTVGEIATEFAQKLFQADQYTDYLYYYGLSVQTAEAMAEWCHARIRQELGYGDREPDTLREILQQRYQGSRYSFGYPACPHIPDQYKQLDLLKTDRIGMWMDESEQLYPEQSTTAIITYHPVAKYFSAYDPKPSCSPSDMVLFRANGSFTWCWCCRCLSISLSSSFN